MDDVGSVVEPKSSLTWADVIRADFQWIISGYIQNISTFRSSKAQTGLRTIFIQNPSRNMHIHLAKSSRFRIDRFGVSYDWWRRLQPVWSVHQVNLCRQLYGKYVFRAPFVIIKGYFGHLSTSTVGSLKYNSYLLTWIVGICMFMVYIYMYLCMYIYIFINMYIYTPLSFYIYICWPCSGLSKQNGFPTSRKVK